MGLDDADGGDEPVFEAVAVVPVVDDVAVVVPLVVVVVVVFAVVVDAFVELDGRAAVPELAAAHFS